jgi:hypothetical protein
MDILLHGLFCSVGVLAFVLIIVALICIRDMIDDVINRKK